MTFHLNVPDKNDDAKAYVTLVIDTCKHAAFQKKILQKYFNRYWRLWCHPVPHQGSHQTTTIKFPDISRTFQTDL